MHDRAACRCMMHGCMQRADQQLLQRGGPASGRCSDLSLSPSESLRENKIPLTGSPCLPSSPPLLVVFAGLNRRPQDDVLRDPPSNSIISGSSSRRKEEGHGASLGTRRGAAARTEEEDEEEKQQRKAAEERAKARVAEAREGTRKWRMGKLTPYKEPSNFVSEAKGLVQHACLLACSLGGLRLITPLVLLLQPTLCPDPQRSPAALLMLILILPFLTQGPAAFNVPVLDQKELDHRRDALGLGELLNPQKFGSGSEVLAAAFNLKQLYNLLRCRASTVKVSRGWVPHSERGQQRALGC